jgi:hypothetical protein
MTSKNFHGTLSRWGWTGTKRYPTLTWVILSHKYGRWITPFLLIATFISSIVAWLLHPMLYWNNLMLTQGVFYGLGLLGYLRLPIPLAGTIFSFLLGNYGMMCGVIKALTGNVSASYTPIRNQSN